MLGLLAEFGQSRCGRFLRRVSGLDRSACRTAVRRGQVHCIACGPGQSSARVRGARCRESVGVPPSSTLMSMPPRMASRSIGHQSFGPIQVTSRTSATSTSAINSGSANTDPAESVWSGASGSPIGTGVQIRAAARAPWTNWTSTTKNVVILAPMTVVVH